MTGSRGGGAGGSAMGAGGSYQARIAAWLAAHALAEHDAQPPLQLTSPVKAVGCEGPDPVDDVVARTLNGHTAALQAKRTVSVSRRRTVPDGSLTPYASAIDQFVRQYVLARDRALAGAAAALDATHDRLVLAVGAEAPATIRRTLARVLDRIRLQSAEEPLLSSVLNQQARQVLETFLEHARASWEEATGARPEETELLEFLRLVHVETVSVEEGDSDEAAALTLLRRSVLYDPKDAHSAWAILVQAGTRLITDRSSIAAAQLRSLLEEHGIRLRGVRSYREDIERLKRHSAEMLMRLRDYATIPLDTERIQIERPYAQPLRDAAESGSVLVVGEPGIGKSGAMHRLAAGLLEDGRDVLVLTAHDPPFTSPAELRDSLRLEHEVVDVLANWPGQGQAFLIIDALDAARTDAAAQALRQLIGRVRQTAGRWNVIASVREYDARYGRELQRLFRGEVPTGPCAPLPGDAFNRVRHLVVGELTDQELEQLLTTSPRLHALVATAPPALQQLFRTPFNLRLAAELMESGTEPDAIREVQNQLELLDLFWSERVLAGGDARLSHAREAVLAKAVRAMVEGRSLRADTRIVSADPAASEGLNALLRAHVLTEWKPATGRRPDRYTLTFAHHVLFDYAVKRLLLPSSPAGLAELLGSDPDLVLLARPSLVMHFHERWRMDDYGRHRVFWEHVLAVAEQREIPEIGKLLGPSIAAELMRSPSDLEPLVDSLGSENASIRSAAENAFYHFIRSAPADVRNAVDRVAAWCALLDAVSHSFTDGTAYPTRTLLWDLTKQAGNLAPLQLAQIGAASRRLLEFAWSRDPRDGSLVVHALQYVCRTFGSDPTASAKLLRRAIAREHLAKFGSEELQWIAREVERLIEFDAELVRDVYAAAFNYREESDAPSPMGGIVMPMISNRRQDYSMALYGLKEVFPAFLGTTPEHALEAMNAAVEAHIAQDRNSGGMASEEAFDFAGEEARIAPDYSQIWDRGQAYPGDYAIEILDEVERRIARLSSADGDAEQLRRLVGLLARTTRHAVVWRRLLNMGAKHPQTLGLILQPLLYAVPILYGMETTGPAGRLIHAIAPYLAEEDQERVERAIMSLPVDALSDNEARMERIRDRLLGCLDEAGAITEAALNRLAALRAEDAILPCEEDAPTFGAYSRNVGDEEYLAEKGVPVEDVVNRRVRDIEAPVAEFASRHSNAAPDAAAVSDVLPQLKALRETLDSAVGDGVHPLQAGRAWRSLAGACVAVAKSDEIEGMPEAEAFVREVLLAASLNPEPRAEPEADRAFIDPTWGPAARIDAAEGLMVLAGRAGANDTDVAHALDLLMADPAPAVRFQLAVRLHGLYRNAPDRCWRMIEHMVGREASLGVALGLLQWPLRALRFLDENRVARLTSDLYARFADEPRSEKVRAACADVLANLHIARNHADSGSFVAGIPAGLMDHLDEAAHLVRGFREILIAGPVDGGDSDSEARRRRALIFLLDVTRAAAAAFKAGAATENDNVDESRESTTGKDQLETLARLLHSVAFNLYFVSGAYEKKAAPAPAVQARLLREAGPIIDELAEVGLAPVTHPLLETLEVLVPHDPRGVFRRVAAVIRGGRKGNYQYDKMAETVLVRVVERYLADFRSIFQEDERARRDLVEVLDTFVQAGSEGARRLSYGLDGICVIRSNPAADSGASRPPIPVHSGHRFRSNPATDSGDSGRVFRSIPATRQLSDAGQSKPLSRRSFSAGTKPCGGADGGGAVVHAQDQGGTAASGRGSIAASHRAERGGCTQYGQRIPAAGRSGWAELAAAGRSLGHGPGGAALSTPGAVDGAPSAAELACGP